MQYCSRKKALFKGFGSMQYTDASIGFGNNEECRNPWAGFADGLDDAEIFQPSKLRTNLVAIAQRKSAERHLNRRHLLIDLKMAQIVEQIRKFGHYCLLGD